MAKKPAAAKTEAPQAPAQAQKKVTFLTAKHWATGTVNQTGEPILIIESAEGANIGIRLSAQYAADISKALAGLLAKQPANKTN